MPHRQHRNANAAPPQSRHRRRVPRRSEWVIGTLVELDVESGRVKVRVAEARGIPLSTDLEVTVDASHAALKATDGDGDGRPGITDLFPGDELKIEFVRPVDGCPLAATRITQRSPGAPRGGLRRLWSRLKDESARGVRPTDRA